MINQYLKNTVSIPKIFVRNKGESQTWKKRFLEVEPFLTLFEVKMLNQIALELVQPIFEDKKLQLINSSLGALIVERIMAEIKGIKYKPNEIVTFATAREVYEKYIQLAKVGFSKDHDPDLVVIFDRIEDEIIQLNLKSEHVFLSEIELYKLAIDRIEIDLCRFEGDLLIDGDFYPTNLELDFLKALSQNSKIYIIKNSKLLDVSELKDRFLSAKIKVQDTFALQAENQVSIETFSGYGRTNEIKGVLNTIMTNHYLLDECEVLYLDQKYHDEIIRQMERLELNVVSESGLTVKHSDSYVFVDEFITYVMNDFDISALENTLTSIRFDQERLNDSIDFVKCIENKELIEKIKEVYISGSEWKAYLIELHMDYGFERIESILKHFNEVYEKKIDNLQSRLELDDADEKAIKKKEIKELKMYLLTVSLWAIIRKGFENSSTPKSIQHILTVVKEWLKWGKISNSKEGIYKKTIINQLNLIIELIHPEISHLKFKNIMEMIGALSIDSSVENSGALRVAPLMNKGTLHKKHTFIVGLDSLSYPVECLESPIVPDALLRDIDVNLETSAKKAEKIRLSIERLITSSAGDVWLSYSNYDIANCRSQNPSGLWLKYKTDESKVINYEIVNEETIRSPLEGLFFFQKDLLKQVECDNDLEDKEFTCFKSESPIDISATKLDVATECRYKYFLKYVLRLPEPKEITRFDKWLAPFELGLLIHEVFENFINKIIENNLDFKDEEVFLSTLDEVFDTEVKKLLAINPPKNPDLYKREMDLARRNIRSYAKELLREYLRSWKPFKAEYKINQEMEISKIKVNVNGSIDRIDVLRGTDPQNKSYRIVDYKTGKAKNLDIENKMQNALYYLVMQELIDKGMFENHMTFVNAKYEMIYDLPKSVNMIEDSNKIKDKIEKLQDLIKCICEGKFEQVDEKQKGVCTFCDYNLICRRKEVEVDGY